MSNSTVVKVSSRNEIAVPALARHLLNIQGGDLLLVDVQDGIMVLIIRPESYTATLAGLHQEIWKGMDAQGYIDQERDV